jgi:hypothetical protein
MKFKEGDIVICINDNDVNLLINKKYIIYYIKYNLLFFDMNGEIVGGYRTDKFKLFSEVRKEKLKMLRNGI